MIKDKSKSKRIISVILMLLVAAVLSSCTDKNIKSDSGLEKVSGIYHSYPVFFKDESASELTLYGAEEGKVFKYDGKPVTFDLFHNGIKYEINMTEFFGPRGSICIGSFDGSDDVNSSSADSFEATWEADPIDYGTTVIYLDIPLRHRYPILYDNATGETTDILEDMRTAILNINNIIFSPDRTKLLLFCDEETEIYYCDLVTREMTYIPDLTGIPNVNGAMWISDGTLALMRTSKADPFSPEVEVFEYDIAENTHSITLRQSSKYHEESGKFMGVILFDGHYGVIAYSGGETASIDFKTGEIFPIEGFTFENDGDIGATTYKNGTHLLCRHTDKFTKSQTVAIIDLPTGKPIKSCKIPSKYKYVMYIDENHFAAATGSVEFQQEYVIFSFD